MDRDVTRARKMIVQMVFRKTHILDRRGMLAADELGIAIDPKPAHEFYFWASLLST